MPIFKFATGLNIPVRETRNRGNHVLLSQTDTNKDRIISNLKLTPRQAYKNQQY